MALGSSIYNLYGILPQLVGYSNGFIVNLGTYPTSNTPINAQGYVQVGTLQVGLTDQDIASFPTLIAMQGNTPGTLFPVTNEPIYTERLGAGNVEISNGSVSYSGATSFVFDTGAPSTEVHPNTTEATDIASIIDNDGNLVPGTTFTIASPGATQPVPPGTVAANWQMSFPTVNQSGLNQVGIASPDSGTGYVNTGLQPFFQGPAMYDVSDGVIGFNSISCFALGTRIATPTGEVPVEALCIGDLVRTRSGGTRMITWIGHRTVDSDLHADPASILPIRIATGAFAPGQPARDLLLSPDHAVYFEGVLIPIKYLLNSDTVHQVPAREVTYFHIELEQHDIVLADGLPVESYLDTGSRTAFANGGAAIQLHPNFASSDDQTSLRWEADGCAPLVVSGPPIERARRVLRRQSQSQRRRASH
jgi:collagen type I/II/III/V/XI/XXIV/XXVII alpha